MTESLAPSGAAWVDALTWESTDPIGYTTNKAILLSHAERQEYLRNLYDVTGAAVPHSASTFSPVALYNFDGNLNATVGTNLTLAHGTARYTKIHKLPGFFFDGSTDLATAAAVPALAITGAMTIMWVQQLTTETGEYPTTPPSYGISRIAFYGQEDGAGSGTEAENTPWSVAPHNNNVAPLEMAEFFWENGSGTPAGVSIGSPGFRSMFLDSFCHIAITRAADGVTCNLYMNGILVGTETASDAPTGGSDAGHRLRVGGFNDSLAGWLRIYGFLGSLKICASELTAANVLSEYEYCFGNVHGTL